MKGIYRKMGDKNRVTIIRNFNSKYASGIQYKITKFGKDLKTYLRGG